MMKNDKHRHLFAVVLLACVLAGSSENAQSENIGQKFVFHKAIIKEVIQLTPLYRIELRVHLADSKRAPRDFLPIFEEINTIWKSQAGICFEIQTVDHDDPLANGIDMWFSPYIGGFNGYYDGEQIQMTDNPILNKAPNPAKFSAARTAAHEIGHALNLPHRQNSDDNLMRSKTYGWQLNANEVHVARKAALDMSLPDTTQLNCSPAKIN